MRASDQRIPERTATAQVTISITRDNAVPFFIASPYFVRISEARPVGDSILTVQASDNDLVVS